MSEVPPVGTSLGNLRITTTIIEYDGPRLFICQNLAGQSYLATFVDERDDAELYLYVPISSQRLERLKRGEMSLRQAFDKPEDDVAVIVTRTLTDAETEPGLQYVTGRDIPGDWLPEEGLSVNLPDEEVFDPEEFRRTSTRRLQSAAAFELHTDRRADTMPIRSLGNFLHIVQDSVEAFAQEVRGRPTAVGSIPRDIVEQTELVFDSLRAASLVLVVEPSSGSPPSESPLVSEALRRVMSIMEVADSGDSLRREIGRLGSRSRSKYHRLLEYVYQTGTGLTLFLYGDDGRLSRASLDATRVESSLAVLRSASEPSPRELSTPTIRTFEIDCVLVGVSTRTRRFELLDESSNTTYTGTAIATAGSKLLGLTTGMTYEAFLQEETDVSALPGSSKSRYLLMDINPL